MVLVFFVSVCGSCSPRLGTGSLGWGSRVSCGNSSALSATHPLSARPALRTSVGATVAAPASCPILGAGNTAQRHPSALDPVPLVKRGSVPTSPHPRSTPEGSTAEPRTPAPGSIPALTLMPLGPSPGCTSPAWEHRGSQGTTVRAARPGTLGTHGDPVAQPSPQAPQPTHSLLTPWPMQGRPRAFCQRMSGFSPRGRAMFLLPQICRWVLEGRRSKIITAPVARSGSGSNMQPSDWGICIAQMAAQEFQSVPRAAAAERLGHPVQLPGVS